MKQLFFTAIFLISLSPIFQTSAQNPGDTAWVVRLGHFAEAGYSDFDKLRELGFVFAERQANGVKLVSLGGYSQEAVAAQYLSLVRQKGYPDAYPQMFVLATNADIPVIQLSTLQAGKAPDWAVLYQSGANLFAYQNDNQVVYLQGGFASTDAAREALALVKNSGFPKAFVRMVPKNLAVAVTEFESGLSPTVAKPAIENPVARSIEPAQPQPTEKPSATISKPTAELAKAATEPANAPKPSASDAAKTTRPATPKAVPAPPTITPNLKRTAALEIQLLLKREGLYTGSLDGQYGAGTASAFDNFTRRNRQWQKYTLLASAWKSGIGEQEATGLQRAMYELWDKPEVALAVLKQSTEPLAKAWQAYWTFVKNGPSKTVDDLMNAAIKEAFATSRKVSQPFDAKATYSYSDLAQLLLHTRYVMEAWGSDEALPCYLFERHQREADAAFAKSPFLLQPCDPFAQWPEVKVLLTLASDISHQPNETTMTLAASRRSRMYLNPEPATAQEAKLIVAWNGKLWAGLEGWASTDPMHRELVTALKAAFYQSQLRIEEFYIGRGLKPEDAKHLAMIIMQQLVGEYLARFI
jgi:peptidoglycan hydrolase-like protein with peptidoglycan-binding domain